MGTYYTERYTGRGLSSGIMKPGELAVCTGTVNNWWETETRRRAVSRGPGSRFYVFGMNADGAVEELAEDFRYDALDDSCGGNSIAIREMSGMEDTFRLSVKFEEALYRFELRRSEGLLTQTAGPEKPVILMNGGMTPLRADTRMGRYLVHAGTVRRLDEHGPFREAGRPVWLTFDRRTPDRAKLCAAETPDGRPLNFYTVRCEKDDLRRISEIRVLERGMEAQIVRLCFNSDMEVRSPDCAPDDYSAACFQKEGSEPVTILREHELTEIKPPRQPDTAPVPENGAFPPPPAAWRA